MTQLVSNAFFMRQLPAPYEREGWGILNSAGHLWTDEIFDRPENAQEYVEQYWNVDDPGLTAQSQTDAKNIASGFRYVRVKRTVAISPDAKQNGVRVTIVKQRQEEQAT